MAYIYMGMMTEFFWMIISETLGRILWGTRLYFEFTYPHPKEAYELAKATYKDISQLC